MLKTGNSYKELFRLKKGDTIPVFYGKNKQLYRISPENLVSDLDNRLKILENNEYKVTYFQVIDSSTGTAGSFPFPTNSTLVTNGQDGNAALSTLNGNSYPEGRSPKETNETPITANLTAVAGNGDWVSSNTYTDPVGIIFQLIILGKDLSNLDSDYILDFYNIDQKYDNIKIFGEEFTGDGSSNQFDLTGAIANASFVEGSWDNLNIINFTTGGEIYPIPARTGTGAGRAIYNKPFGETEDPAFEKIVTIFQTGPTVTLQFPPILGELFTIWYGYKLKEDDNLGNTYFKPDVTAISEAGYAYVKERFLNRPVPQNINLNSSLSNVTRTFAGGKTTWEVTHTLDSLDIRVQNILISNNETVELNVIRTSTTTVEIEVLGDVADNTYKTLIRL